MEQRGVFGGFVVGTRSALLVDGENLSAAHAQNVIAAAVGIAQYDVFRVYGDAGICTDWARVPGAELIHSGKGKNAADVLLSLEAAALALERGVEVFVLASSDGDFCHIARFLRERGKRVIGIGEEKTPTSFRAACSQFVELRTQRVETAPTPAKPTPSPQTNPSPPNKTLQDVQSEVELRICEVIRTIGGEQGMTLSALNGEMRKCDGFHISKTTEKTWRAWIMKRPHLFDCEKRSATARVRLKVKR